MRFLKRHPAASGLLIAVFGALGSLALGVVIAGLMTKNIAEGVLKDHPDDPLDGLWIIALFIVLVIGGGGAFGSIVAGWLVWLRNRE